MHRITSVMSLKENMEVEYKKRHDEIWPELQSLLKEHTVSNYSIHLHSSTNQLFAYLEVDDLDKYNQLPKHPLMKKWWEYMEEIMDTNPDSSPVSIPLLEVFYLE